MQKILFEVENLNDIDLLLHIAKRLNIKAIIKDKNHELTERELTIMCMKLSETSLAKDWDEEDDEYWNKFIKHSPNV